jgi:hypothetical protein
MREMTTIEANIEFLDVDEGQCGECGSFATVITAVVYLDRAPGEVVAMCAGCLDGTSR